MTRKMIAARRFREIWVTLAVRGDFAVAPAGFSSISCIFVV
jgi:hypothetical protein